MIFFPPPRFFEIRGPITTKNSDTAAATQAKKFQRQIEDLEVKNRALESGSAAAKTESKDISDRYTAKCTEIAALKSTWESEKQGLFDKIEDSVAQYRKLEKTLEEVLFERDRLQNELQELNQLHGIEYDKVQSQIEKISDELKFLKAENVKYKDQVAELTKYKEKYKAATNEVAAKEKLISDLEDQLEKSEGGLQSLKEKLDRLTLELMELKTASKKDEAATGWKKGKSKALMGEIELLQNKIRSLRFHTKG